MNKSTRICIIGNSGSGKSTLANELARHLNIPVYHLDRELLHGQFVPHSFEEQRSRHRKLIDQDNWIIEGNYRSLMADRFGRATLVVFLDVSRLQAIPRTVTRYWKNDQLESSIPEGAKNGLSWKFLKWVLTYSRKEYLEQIKRENPARLLILRSGTLEDWVEKVVTQLSKAESGD